MTEEAVRDDDGAGGGGELGRRLVGRLGRGHEQHAVQVEDLADFVGHEQVTEVDRVERPPEHADPRPPHATRGYARRPTRRTDPRPGREQGGKGAIVQTETYIILEHTPLEKALQGFPKIMPGPIMPGPRPPP